MDNKKFDLAMNVIKYAIGIIGAIACIWVLTSNPGSEALEKPQVRADFAESGSISMAINYTVIIIGAALAGVLLFFVFQLVTNTKKTALSIAGIVAAFVLYMILRLIGTSDTNETLQLGQNYHVSDATLDATTAGLWVVIIGIIVGFLLAVLGPFLLGKYRK
ncbi:MAG: hypothetical protein DCO96_01170 [Fluviicola sp. XM-24bin1]|nr:MAG: hypothetical protein DCO96_01170 [Fluviicola sp. XM-24bin1]